MEEIYTNLDNTAAFRGEKELFNATRPLEKTRQEVKNYLQGNTAYTLHKITRKRFSRRRFQASGPGKILAGDVCYMDKLAEFNDGYKYLGIFMDLYSRFVVVKPLKTLRGTEMAATFQEVIDNDIVYKPSHFLTDEGIEYYNKDMDTVYKSYQIKHYSTFNRDIKVGPVERFIRTLKSKIYKYLTHTQQNRYIDDLVRIIDTYNVTPHGGLFYNTPFDIYLLQNQNEIDDFTMKLNKYHERKAKPISKPLAVGTYARIPALYRTQDPFNKAYLEQNTREIFKVRKVNSEHVPITYTVEDLEGVPILGIFYHQELTPTAKPEDYRIEILKTRKTKKGKEYLVKYLDYRNSSPVWISADMLT